MSVAARLSAWVVIAATAALGLFAWSLLRAEERDLALAAENEVRTLTGSVQVSIENALRDAQHTDVTEVLDRVEALSPAIDVYVIGDDGGFVSSNAAVRALPDRLVPVVDGVRRTAREAWDPQHPGMTTMTSAVRLSDGGRALGVLVVVRRLDDMRADLARTRRAVATTAVAAILLLAIVTVVVATVVVKRPLTKTMTAMRAVKAGDLDAVGAVVDVDSNDELGEIAREFNALVRALRDSRRQVDEEQELRRRLERTVWRADKLAAIGQLAAGVAHEIGTPLHIVAGRARTLTTKSRSGVDAAEVARIGGIIVEQSERITRTVTQLLDYARPPQRAIGAVDIARPVRAVVELLDGEARRRGITVTTTLPTTVPRVRADDDQVQQVVLNLLRNALNAGVRGGHIELIVDVHTMLPPGAEQRRPALRLRVIDDGAGIAADVLPHIFEPFFTTGADRVDGDGTNEPGTGLGLPVVRGIVQAWHGTIDVVSRSAHNEDGPRGTTFTVCVPLDDVEQKERP